MNVSAIKTPGVYVNEVSIFPPSVAQVPTAIPAFVGYTEKAEEVNGESLEMKFKKLSSMVEFELYFGYGPALNFDKATGHGVEIDANGVVQKAQSEQDYFLYDAVQMFFYNGGGDCYVISVGTYDDAIILGTTTTGMTGGLEVLKEIDEPTMIVFPDAVSLGTNMYKLQQAALQQCADMMDRVGVFDVHYADTKTNHDTLVQQFRDNIGMSNLKYGAIYTPWLKVGLKKDAKYRDIKGEIVKAGTTVEIKLNTIVSSSLSNAAEITDLITDLDEITSDNSFINDQIGDFLDHLGPNVALYWPDGYSATEDLPSLQDTFDLLTQSVNNKIAIAKVEPAATQEAMITDAAEEFSKIIVTIFQLVDFIDNFGFKDPSFMQNDDMVNNTLSMIAYSAPLTPISLPNTFDDQVTAFLQFDAGLSSTAGGVVEDAITLGGFALPVRDTSPFDLTPFDAINMAAVGGTAVVVIPGMPTQIATLPAERIANLEFVVTRAKDFFTFFHTIIEDIQALGKAFEASKEAALLAIWPVYKNMIDKINSDLTLLPPSGAIAGIYARVDGDRGVWKAPANVSVSYADGVVVNITDKIQENLNVDVNAGKSINAIRSFSGKGVMVWGARTLAGNDNEWRYVPVRRFFNMVEESVKKSTSWVVFEPNDANTWVKVKSMIENYLTLLWRQGALAGAKPEEAFFVEVGLNKTMTFVDILEGRMIIKIGMAAVRPAEFIILEFSHKIQTS